MASQPPSRPWFRLPVLGRQAPPPAPPPPAAAAPAPATQAQPRPPFIRPTFSQTFRNPDPQPPLQPSPRSSPPSLRPPTAVSPPPASPSPQPSPSPPPSMASPKTSVTSPLSRTPPPSEFVPKTSPILSPVSPSKPQVPKVPPPPGYPPNSMKITYPPKSLSYPATTFANSPTPTRSPTPPFQPSPKTSPITSAHSNSSKEEPEPEQEPKKVLVQETSTKQMVAPTTKNNSINGFDNNHNNSSKYDTEVDRRMPRYVSEDARNVKILTVAGENRGAIMDLGFVSRRNRGHGTTDFNVANEAQESQHFQSSRTEDSSPHKGLGKSSHLPINVYVNSNAQSSNSSILLNSTITLNDPGVHFYLSKKPFKGNGKEIGVKDRKNSSQV